MVVVVIGGIDNDIVVRNVIGQNVIVNVNKTIGAGVLRCVGGDELLEFEVGMGVDWKVLASWIVGMVRFSSIIVVIIVIAMII